jgi:cupin-like protein
VNAVPSGAVFLSAHEPPAVTRLLDIRPSVFRENFDRRPFRIGHRLCDHPLFALPRLLELARALPEDEVEYNAGDIPMSVAAELTPRTGLSMEETIRRIADCKSWMALKRVEADPDYRRLLVDCLSEISQHSEPLHPGMQLPQGFIFLSSPGAVTPYHMDPEHNFLLQIRGSKVVSLFDGRDRSIVSEEDLERFYASRTPRNMVFDEAYQPKAMVFTLTPGQGLHFPVTSPHWVQNGPEVSVSFSVTFRTPDLERRSAIHALNARLRERGWSPAPLGRHRWRDGIKYPLFRAWRKSRAILGRAA